MSDELVKGVTVRYKDFTNYLVCLTCGSLVSKSYMSEHTKLHQEIENKKEK